VAGAVLLVSGIAFLLADHPPTLDGKSVALVFELKIPPALKIPDKPSRDSVHASLYATDRDNRYAVLDYKAMAFRDDSTIIPGRIPLGSQTFHRHLLVSIGDDTAWPQVVKLKLRAKPTKQDEVWSDWITATEHADLSLVPEAERISARYRVEPED
jgi:hypothetical protein